jgi:hypothetical protein
MVREYDRGMHSDRDLFEDHSTFTEAYLELTMNNDAELAVVAARLMTLEILRAVARDVGDPFPWALFLRRLLALPETPDVVAAFTHLYEVAQQMLNEQELQLLRPEDLLAVGPIERALRDHAAFDSPPPFASSPSFPKPRRSVTTVARLR